MKRIIFVFSLFSHVTLAQYAPAAGQPGSSAISKDSSIFVAWATSSIIQRGLQDISDPSLGYTTAGDSSSVVGIPGTSGVVSLGDGGEAIVSFLYPVKNGPSWDFAVFENSFSDDFLELAFVEVSSDGVNYFRFPAHSLTDTLVQTASFGSTSPTAINNLAGKYRGLYGTPFDLQELSGTPGLDLDHISKIKIIDVIGNIQDQYASYDTAGRKINDPWPTPFASGGFDLDAIGVIHQNTTAGIDEMGDIGFSIYPNPCLISQSLFIELKQPQNFKKLNVFDLNGGKIYESDILTLPPSLLIPGVYVIEIKTRDNYVYRKKLILFE
jgi:hypothetical protein